MVESRPRNLALRKLINLYGKSRVDERNHGIRQRTYTTEQNESA